MPRGKVCAEHDKNVASYQGRKDTELKPLKYPVSKSDAAYMQMRQAQNRVNCQRSRAEAVAVRELAGRTDYHWTRQASWGNRLFDFWCSDIGCAVEIDGPEHNPRIDAYRDEYNFRRSAIVVLRVRNFNHKDMDDAISHIASLNQWRDRRCQIGIDLGSKKANKWLAGLPYPPSYLSQYLASHRELNGDAFCVD